MTRTHVAKKLLEHGPLTFCEFVTITGWTVRQCRKTLGHMQSLGQINSEGRGVYSVHS